VQYNSNKMSYLFGVLSQAGVSLRREAVMDTWFNLIKNGDKLVFIVGDPSIIEPKLVENILTVPCQDTYEALCEKTKWFLSWASKKSEFKYIFKCDDDTYVRPERLESLPDFDYVGFFWAHIDPLTKILDQTYFASGGAGYLLKNKHSKKVSETIPQTQLKYPGRDTIEDMMVGLSVRDLGLSKKHTDLLQPGCAYATKIPKRNNKIISGHYLSPIEMRKVHADF